MYGSLIFFLNKITTHYSYCKANNLQTVYPLGGFHCIFFTEVVQLNEQTINYQDQGE